MIAKILILIATLLVVQPAPAQEQPVAEGWPRLYKSKKGTLVVYQPQIQSWKSYARMKALVAVQVKPAGQKKGFYGTIQLDANTSTNFDTRLVRFSNIRISEIRFPNVDAALARRFENIIRTTMDINAHVPYSLDRVIANLERSKLEQKPVQVNLEPPPIYRSERPAILINFMGEPRFEPLKPTGLLFAVNTNWDLFLDPRNATYYLLNGQSWLKTKDVLKGPWRPAGKLPADFKRLPQDDNWKDVAKQVPGKTARTVPAVFVSQEPAELIVTDGTPSYSPISGTPLLYVANTDSDVFLHSGQGQFYFLTAGRWFRAKSLDGPWKVASTDLPSAFAKIPAKHTKAHVRASVPGTTEAEAALLLASIPQRATVDRKTTKVTVVYEGDPKFVVIEGTTVWYAVNTPYSVFKVKGAYYTCHQGVWFCSMSSRGPWQVCTKVPNVIYTIPSTHPKYNVTYVHIYDTTPDTVVVGYTAGYSGAYVAATGTLMFGLGYSIGHIHYDHVHYHYSHYHYHSHYYSYGAAARYDYYHGGYYRSATAYGPYGGAGRYAAYNPATGTYSRGAYQYGPRGGAYAREAYNPYTDRYAAQAGAQTPYGSWGRSVVADGDDWARAGHRSNWRGSVAAAETSEGGKAVAGHNKITGNSGFAAKDKDNDVYAGKNGNVYKRDSSGTWQKRSDGSWQTIDRNQFQLNREYRSRRAGEYSSSTFNRTRTTRSGSLRRN